jgi:DNA helicase-2/ATP-dependent DNA helicase PcrA
MEFNQQQQEIINSIEGAYLISAPVGTGKTTVLTERILKALEAGILPEEIMCLTFTNRAAEEMLERIRKSVSKKDVFEKMQIGTFHGFCAYFIRAEAKELGINSDFVIFDESEQYELMARVLEKFPGILKGENEKKEIMEMLEKVYKKRLGNLEHEIGLKIKQEVDGALDAIGEAYKQALEEQNALDFNELVLMVIEGLYRNEKVRNKWASKFKFIQVDEFQDTHLSEYLVIKELAKVHKNLSFIGDLDQTIYSWRGSDPYFIAELFRRHFAPVKELNLEINYRFNPNILEAVKSFLDNFEKRATKKITSNSAASTEDEKCIEVFSGHNLSEEISWVADKIQEIKKSEAGARIAVLTRANYVINQVAEVFAEKGLEHITVDKYDFFRRQEVKDVFAYLKILFNKFDMESAYRIVQRPHRNIGDTTLKSIREEGGSIGLRVSDFLDFKNYNFLEPFGNLISIWKKGRIIVLDTETTGTNVLQDEIIQIYAVEVVDGKIGKDFHFYLKNTIPVGGSETVHGISDEYLKKEGKEAEKVLRDLKDFIAGDIAIGHNVNFDLTMLLENGKRQGIEFEFREFYDTLDLARRLVVSENYKLNTLAKKFGLEAATHDAKDDVLATAGLLGILIGKLDEAQEKRIQLFAKFSKKFVKLAMEIERWKMDVSKLRPDEALRYAWEKTGLKEYYLTQDASEKRIASIETLVDIFKKKDDAERTGDTVLRELISYATLSRDINFLGLEQGKVPIVTVHQVKGLEFDHVFIIGLNEYSFPIKFQGSNLEEEKRLFYVALTRAKKKIYLSYSKFNSYGRNLAASSFIAGINCKYVKFS